MIARRGPQYPKKGKTRGPRRSTKGHQNAAEQQNRATTTSGQHGQAVLDTTARGGARFTRLCGFPSRASSISGGFCFVLPSSADVSGHSREPNSLPFQLPFSQFQISFQREKERKAKIARILHRVWRSKDGSTFWMSNFFTFSSPFSI